MSQNMGTIDRLVRTVIAVAVGVLYFTNHITGTAAIVLGTLAVIFLVTSAAGFCPLYAPFRWSTRRARQTS